MNHDLIGAVELTASATVVIAALASAFGYNAASRIRAAAWLSAWFVLVVILAATRALHYEHGLGTPGVGLAVVLPIVILCLVVGRAESLREAFHRAPVPLLVSVHTVRLLGISFVVLYATGRLPAPFARRALPLQLTVFEARRQGKRALRNSDRLALPGGHCREVPKRPRLWLRTPCPPAPGRIPRRAPRNRARQ